MRIRIREARFPQDVQILNGRQETFRGRVVPYHEVPDHFGGCADAETGTNAAEEFARAAGWAWLVGIHPARAGRGRSIHDIPLIQVTTPPRLHIYISKRPVSDWSFDADRP